MAFSYSMPSTDCRIQSPYGLTSPVSIAQHHQHDHALTPRPGVIVSTPAAEMPKHACCSTNRKAYHNHSPLISLRLICVL